MLRSPIALKAMTDETTGAVIAAPRTSLPEDVGGVRNWITAIAGFVNPCRRCLPLPLALTQAADDGDG